MSVIGALADAWRLYRVLFPRSIAAAAIVYIPMIAVDLAWEFTRGEAATLFGVLDVLAWLAGPLLVQAALVALVDDLHEGRPPASVQGVLARGARRLVPLFGALLVYVVCVVVGLILLVVPGLYFLARWSLLVPVIVIEQATAGQALDRSSELVDGATIRVLVVVLAGLALDIGSWIAIEILMADVSYTRTVVVADVAALVVAPYIAHTLNTVYYRRAQPGRPLLATESAVG